MFERNSSSEIVFVYLIPGMFQRLIGSKWWWKAEEENVNLHIKFNEQKNGLNGDFICECEF